MADAVNDQAARLTRWLLDGHGALRNVGALLVDAFGPAGAVAAAVGRTTVTAYPLDASARAPADSQWVPEQDGWTHPLHSMLLPESTSAEHHVIVGVTARNDILVINLAAVRYLGIEGGDAVPIMRSWLLQLLAKTPAARVAVTDPLLGIPGAPRWSEVAGAPDRSDATVMFSAVGAPAPRQPDAPAVVAAHAYDAEDVLLCDGDVAGLYLARRYWPLWRRMELAEPQWAALSATLAGAGAGAGAAWPRRAAPAVTAAPGSAPPTGRRRPGLSALGETQLLTVGGDGDDAAATRPVVTPTGVDDTVVAVLGLAAAGGSTAQWPVTDARRLELVEAIRSLLGDSALRRSDEGGEESRLAAEIYCDWQDFDALIGADPARSSDDRLMAAVALIRGAPFEGVPAGGDAAQSIQLLRDELVDRCGDAALELATRQRTAGDTAAAHRSARVGLSADPGHEELWEIAADTVADADRVEFAAELAAALPNPTAPALRDLVASAAPP